MAYYTQEELVRMGFKSLGNNVKISTKASIYDFDKLEIGDNSRIDDFCVISGKVRLGKFNHITPMCLIGGGVMGVCLEDFCTLSYSAKVFSQSDDYSGRTLVNSLIPKKFKQEKYDGVHLGKHVIVGAGSIIFPGVSVGEGCSIGAMTLLNKSTKPWGIYVGIPARRIKQRSRDLLELEKIFIEEHSNDSL